MKELQGKTALVTGCAGFIGSHFCENLLRQGCQVVGVDNLNDFYSVQIKEKNKQDIIQAQKKHSASFVFHHLDIRNKQAIQNLFSKTHIDIIVHLAAMAGVRPSMQNPELYADVNYTGTQTLLETAHCYKIPHFVFASSSSVYGNCKNVPFSEEENVDSPVSHYAATKRAGEIACSVYHNVYGLNAACLRFFTVYGPRQRPDLAINKFTHQIMQGKEISIFGDGSKQRDFTYIDDIVDGLLKTCLWLLRCQKPQYEIFNLGESQTTSVNELISIIEQALGTSAKKICLPDIVGDVRQTYANIDKARNILGYAPQTKLYDGIQKYIDWIKAGR